MSKVFTHMADAWAASIKSKDPSTQVGAAIFDADGRPVSTGYNGFAQRIPDLQELLDNRGVKLLLTLHAELNAVLFSPRPLEGCTVYVYPMTPCSRCAAVLAQKRIRRVVTFRPTPEQEGRWGEDFKWSRWQLERAGIELEERDDLEEFLRYLQSLLPA